MMLGLYLANPQLDAYTAVTLLYLAISLLVFAVGVRQWATLKRGLSTRMEDVSAIVLMIVAGTSVVTQIILFALGLLGMLRVRLDPWWAVLILCSAGGADAVAAPIVFWLMRSGNHTLRERQRFTDGG